MRFFVMSTYEGLILHDQLPKLVEISNGLTTVIVLPSWCSIWLQPAVVAM